MGDSMQVQMDKIKVDIKTLMKAVKKLVLEQRETNMNVEIVETKMKKFNEEKDSVSENTKIDKNIKILNELNTEISLLVKSVGEKVNKIEEQVQENEKHLESIDEKKKTSNVVDNLASSEVNNKSEMCDIKTKLKIIDERIESYEQEIKTIETRIYKYTSENLKKVSKGKVKKHECDICDSTFDSNYNLEVHISSHQEVIPVKCDSCEQTFFSNWRLKIHKRGHQKEKKRSCHYYNNQLECPFEKVGCKFDHRLSRKCKFGSECQILKCQFRHQEF